MKRTSQTAGTKWQNLPTNQTGVWLLVLFPRNRATTVTQHSLQRIRIRHCYPTNLNKLNAVEPRSRSDPAGSGRIQTNLTQIRHQDHTFSTGSTRNSRRQQRSTETKEKEKETYEAVVVDGVDVLLLGDHVAEAAARRVLEGDAGRLGAEDAVDVVAVVELVVEALGHLDGLGGVAVLHDDEVVRLEEGPPHLKEVEVADRRDHDVQLVLEQRRRGDRRPGDSHRARHCRWWWWRCLVT
jgi:hypothetical protein